MCLTQAYIFLVVSYSYTRIQYRRLGALNSVGGPGHAALAWNRSTGPGWGRLPRPRATGQGGALRPWRVVTRRWRAQVGPDGSNRSQWISSARFSASRPARVGVLELLATPGGLVEQAATLWRC